MAISLLVNGTEWHIETPSADSHRTLREHREQLFKSLLPEKSIRDYHLRLSCGYDFALAEGAGKAQLDGCHYAGPPAYPNAHPELLGIRAGKGVFP